MTTQASTNAIDHTRQRRAEPGPKLVRSGVVAPMTVPPDQGGSKAHIRAPQLTIA